MTVREIIRLELDTRCCYLVATYILSKGTEYLSRITEDDIQKVEGNGIMDKEFTQALVRCSARICREISTDDILQFIVKECDRRTITYDRMSELATLFKDGLMEDDEYEAIIYFNETCDMDEEEKEYFGIEEEDEDYE